MATNRTTSGALLGLAVLVLCTRIIFTSRNRETQSDDDEERSKSTSTQTDSSDNHSVKSPSKAPPVTEEATESLRLVVQRFRQASFLVDGQVVSVGDTCAMVKPVHMNNTKAESSTCGLLVYISFAKSATTEKALQAAKTLLNLPLLTQGSWGDGSKPASLLDMAASQSKPYLLLVPQANLICKVKNQGKSIQYHGQIAKDVGNQLYDEFVNYIRALVLEHQYETRQEPVPTWITAILVGAKKSIDACVPPQQMFRDKTVYSAWDADGIPTKNVNGEELTRSAFKKMKKLYESHKKRHEKYLKIATTTSKPLAKTTDWSLLDPEFCTVVAGTFGARQGLEISSDMGPFCHVISS